LEGRINMYKCICNKITEKETDKDKLSLVGSKCGKCVENDRKNKKMDHSKAI